MIQALLLSSLLLSCVAAATASPTVYELPPWLVEEAREGRVAETLAASSVIGPQRWQGQSIAGLREALMGAPGLVLLDSFGGFEPPRISVRGSGVQSAPTSRGVSFSLDGLPLGLADGSFNSALFDPALASHVEVTRGGAAWQQSTGVMGGGLELATRLAGESDELRVRAELGSFGARRGGFQTAGKHGAMGTSVAATWNQQAGYREHSTQERASVLAGMQLGAWRISVLGTVLEYEVPGPLTMAAFQANARGVSSEVRRDQPRREATYGRVAAQGAWKWGRTQTGLGMALAHTEDEFYQLQGNGLSESSSLDLSARAYLERRLELGGLEQRLGLRVQSQVGWRQLRRFSNDAALKGLLFGDDDLAAQGTVFVAEDRVALNRELSLRVGVAWLWARRDITDRVANTQTSAATTSLRNSYSRPLPQAALTWKAAPGLAVFGGLTATTEAPSFDELLLVSGAYPKLSRRSQRLMSQRASTWELGARAQGSRVDWELVAYWASWYNEILRLADEKGLPRGAVNAGKTTHRGLEATLRWRVLEGAQKLRFESTLLWSYCQFEDDPVNFNRPLAGLPVHQGRAEMIYERGGGFYAASGCEWTGGTTWVDHGGRLGYGGQAIWNARAGWRAKRHWSCFVEVKNLSDRPWLASSAGVLDLARNPAATAIFLPGAGRGFFVGMEWRR